MLHLLVVTKSTREARLDSNDAVGCLSFETEDCYNKKGQKQYLGDSVNRWNFSRVLIAPQTSPSTVCLDFRMSMNCNRIRVKLVDVITEQALSVNNCSFPA